MKENIYKAVEYANSSNKLENNNLSENELNQIVENILAGRSDQSFLFSVVEAVNQVNRELDATEQAEKVGVANVKVRK